eukprot:1250281-Alexandrium_andersonii.AAC.1
MCLAQALEGAACLPGRGISTAQHDVPRIVRGPRRGHRVVVGQTVLAISIARRRRFFAPRVLIALFHVARAFRR